jgi:hypothetical protein
MEREKVRGPCVIVKKNDFFSVRSTRDAKAGVAQRRSLDK